MLKRLKSTSINYIMIALLAALAMLVLFCGFKMQKNLIAPKQGAYEAVDARG